MIVYRHVDPRDLSNEDLLDTLLWVAGLLEESFSAPRRRRYIALQREALWRMKEREVDGSED